MKIILTKILHGSREAAFENATSDMYREGGTVTVENSTDWHDAYASDKMPHHQRMAMYDLRDSGFLPEELPCYHTKVSGWERWDFFLPVPDLSIHYWRNVKRQREEKEGAK